MFSCFFLYNNKVLNEKMSCHKFTRKFILLVCHAVLVYPMFNKCYKCYCLMNQTCMASVGGRLSNDRISSQKQWFVRLVDDGC